MSIREKARAKPIKEIKTDFKLSEYCPFCKFRRKLQREIKKWIKGNKRDLKT